MHVVQHATLAGPHVGTRRYDFSARQRGWVSKEESFVQSGIWTFDYTKRHRVWSAHLGFAVGSTSIGCILFRQLFCLGVGGHQGIDFPIVFVVICTVGRMVGWFGVFVVILLRPIIKGRVAISSVFGSLNGCFSGLVCGYQPLRGQIFKLLCRHVVPRVAPTSGWCRGPHHKPLKGGGRRRGRGR